MFDIAYVLVIKILTHYCHYDTSCVNKKSIKPDKINTKKDTYLVND